MLAFTKNTLPLQRLNRNKRFIILLTNKQSMDLNCSKNSLLAGLCAIFLLGYSPVTYAAEGSSPLPNEVQQAKKITGTVSDAMGPVIGASVVVKGTSNGVATDFDGNFTLSVNQGQTIVVSYIGYLTKEITIDARNNYQITLEEDKKMLDEVVVVGYGTMKKSDISGASVSLGESAVKGSIITSLDQSLQGRAAGVSAVQTSGAPGSSSAIRVRGTATINANAEPLYVIDGVPVQSGGTSGASYGLGDALGNGSVSTISPLSTIDPSDFAFGTRHSRLISPGSEPKGSTITSQSLMQPRSSCA